MSVPERFTGQRWQELKNDLRTLLEKSPITHRAYFGFYTSLYNICSANLADISYSDVLLFIQKNVKLILTDLITENEARDKLISSFPQCWNKYCKSVDTISKATWLYVKRILTFIYLSPNDQAEALCESFKSSLVGIWKNEIFAAIAPTVSVYILISIDEERSGGVLDGSSVISALQAFMELAGVDSSHTQRSVSPYTRYIEIPYINNAANYYESESSSPVLLHYVKKIQALLKNEDMRSMLYLHPSSRVKVTERLEEVLIRDKYSILSQEYARISLSLINGNPDPEDVEDIKIIRSLVSRSSLTDILTELGTHLTAHIVSEANEKMESTLITVQCHPEVFVSALVEIYSKYDNLSRELFYGDAAFKNSVQFAAVQFVNKNSLTEKYGSNICAEVLAKVLDRVLHGCKSESIPTLDRIMTIFEFLDEKDTFERIYSKLLAQRLLMETFDSEQAEDATVAMLNKICGFAYTIKLEWMIKDIQSSKRLGLEYVKYLLARGDTLSLEFRAYILSSSVWPFCTSPEHVNLPLELMSCMDKFTRFFSLKKSKRKLQWIVRHSYGEISARFNSLYVFRLSAYQMSIVMLFNYQQVYSLGEIAQITQVDSKLMDQVIDPLLEIGLLLKHHETITLNVSFTHIDSTLNLKEPIRSIQFEQKKSQLTCQLNLDAEPLSNLQQFGQ